MKEWEGQRREEFCGERDWTVNQKHESLRANRKHTGSLYSTRRAWRFDEWMGGAR